MPKILFRSPAPSLLKAILALLFASAPLAQAQETNAPAAKAAASGDLDNPAAPLSLKANLVFSDEFDAVPIASPTGKDAAGKVTKWRTSLWFGSGYGRQGGGQAYYTDDFTPPPRWGGSAIDYNAFSVKDGVLSITAKPMDAAESVPGFKYLRYKSGLLTTLDSFHMNYGYFEIRLKCPGALGNWSAFFMYPADDYFIRPMSKYTSWEMDFLEILGNNIDKLNVTTHQKNFAGGPNSNDGTVVNTGPNDDAFHVFGFDKEPGKVDVYRDGKLVLTKPTTSRMTTAGYLNLVLDVGKNGGWCGTPDAAKYPQTLEVDYVRAYRTPATTIVGGPFSSVQMGDVQTTSTP